MRKEIKRIAMMFLTITGMVLVAAPAQLTFASDDNSKYGVKGSPSLVINGTNSSSARDSANLLKAICAGFEEAPEECSTQLSSDTPSPGFGSGVSNSGSEGGCGE